MCGSLGPLWCDNWWHNWTCYLHGISSDWRKINCSEDIGENCNYSGWTSVSIIFIYGSAARPKQ